MVLCCVLSLLPLRYVSNFKLLLGVTGALGHSPLCERTLANSSSCQWTNVSGCSGGTGAHGGAYGRMCECPLRHLKPSQVVPISTLVFAL